MSSRPESPEAAPAASASALELNFDLETIGFETAEIDLRKGYSFTPGIHSDFTHARSTPAVTVSSSLICFSASR